MQVVEALTYGSEDDMERMYFQYVSGWMFSSFGLKPAQGRLLTPNDDSKPGAHPYAVISYDYWTRRFARDPKAIGRTFTMGKDVYEIVGVAPEGFTGTETGTLIDIFVPTMMNAKAIDNRNWAWFRIWVQMKPGASVEQIRQKLQATFSASRRESSKGWNADTPKSRIEAYLNAPLFLEPAAAGVSGMQKNYRRSLVILGVLVVLVLLIACANVANVMTAQAAARAREMALRISIGAGRWRLIRLVLIESALLAIAASVLGGLFAWWSAPFVVGMLNPPDNPARLILPADFRVLGFAVLLALSVTFLFGLVPALRASAVKPMSTLRGGERSALAPAADERSCRCASSVLLSCAFSRGFVCINVRSVGASTDGLFRQSSACSRNRVQERTACSALATSCGSSSFFARCRINSHLRLGADER